MTGPNLYSELPSHPTVVGIREISIRLGVPYRRVRQWRLRGTLPPAQWRVGGSPVWDWATIDAWAKSGPKGVDITPTKSHG